VVLTDTDLVRPALRWTLSFLEANLGDGDFTVFSSADHKFKYYDQGKYDEKNVPDFVPPMDQTTMKFTQFLDKFHNWKYGNPKYVERRINIELTGLASKECDETFFVLLSQMSDKRPKKFFS
jgi:hypothetical protein